MRFHGCSGHRRTLLWGRAAWRAGLLGVPGCLACRAAWRAGGRRPAHSVACSTAGIPGTVTPYCGAGLPGVSAGGGPPAVLLAAPLAFRAPSRLTVEPGCLACRWAAARPRAVRAASFARRVVSKPGQALPPPTGTAARLYPHPPAPQPGPT